MSFGYSVSDLVMFGHLTWKVIENLISSVFPAPLYQLDFVACSILNGPLKIHFTNARYLGSTGEIDYDSVKKAMHRRRIHQNKPIEDFNQKIRTLTVLLSALGDKHIPEGLVRYLDALKIRSDRLTKTKIESLNQCYGQFAAHIEVLLNRTANQR